MSNEQKQIEALKALADWSKWLISIETGLSTVIVLALEGKVVFDQVNFIFGALIFFFISILAATWLLGGIPWAMQQVPHMPDGESDVHGIKVFKIQLRYYAVAEHLFFITALLCLGFAIWNGEFAPPKVTG